MELGHRRQVGGVTFVLPLDEQAVGAGNGVGDNGAHGALVRAWGQGLDAFGDLLAREVTDLEERSPAPGLGGTPLQGA
ncbi:hypothetical protein [Streptomyces sp. NBC_00343]|uniref:hypothetical protein n=1 Tax=Streptomyces sp. NBC_00343 TaxID=2975719 RepID=UPI002E291A4D|nr:hypothetical protein [Streptomyces sp. NBC_00343]